MATITTQTMSAASAAAAAAARRSPADTVFDDELVNAWIAGGGGDSAWVNAWIEGWEKAKAVAERVVDLNAQLRAVECGGRIRYSSR
jgi:hypothetical protein